jgi:pimeloyl-ACP methyl ester carboxylesterase
MSRAQDLPEWFVNACAQAPSTGETVVDGYRVRFLRWAPETPTAPPLLLLHGSTAHAHWWSHLAPLLAADRHVVAMDITGHGDSDHRARYGVDLWADELLAVARAIDPAQTGVVVVGHSLGGHIATVAATRDEHPFTGVIQCETVVGPRQRDPRERPATGGKRYYASAEAAVARFRLTPPQRESLSFITGRIARQSLRQYPEGWSWKFDPGFLTGSPRSHSALLDVVARLHCPIACIYAEHGLVSRDAAARVAAAAIVPATIVELPATGHHPMLDQPLALVAAIRGIIATWEAMERSRADQNA